MILLKRALFGVVLIINIGVLLADYYGEISEDAPSNTEVRLYHDIIVTQRGSLVGENICGYTLYKNEEGDLPFKVVIIEEKSGLAKLSVEGDGRLKLPNYSFSIAAHDCITGNHAPRESVFVKVLQGGNSSAQQTSRPDVPADSRAGDVESTWEQESYTLEVEEGKIYDDILQLEIEGLEGDALRRCQFRIVTPNVPFTIDNEERMGILRNTEKLSWARQHNHIIEVMAFNCGEDEKTARPLIINIEVKPAVNTVVKSEVNPEVIPGEKQCQSGWAGIDEVQALRPDRLVMPLAGDSAALRVCENCEGARVRVTISLRVSGEAARRSCDMGPASMQNQRRLCGGAVDLVDLLPAEVAASNDGVFTFDGKTTAYEVPETKFNHTLDQSFTMMTWMKHSPDGSEMDTHEKKHILCNADGEEKNRHHYAWYVHNCKLELLLRREYSEDIDLQEFQPAEWRWTLNEACDGEWHHYAISVNFPSALLYVDGVPLDDVAHHNPDVIDDWVLHQVSGLHSTKLVVGACWMGAEQRMSAFFNGQLAGVAMVNGETERASAIKCVTNCAERLDFHAMSEMQTGMTVAFNSEMSEITIEGPNAESVETLFRKVGFESSRMNRAEGERDILIHTEVKCTNERPFVFPEIHVSLVVPEPLPTAQETIDTAPRVAEPAAPVEGRAPEQPASVPASTAQSPMTLSGIASITRPARDFAQGVAIFPDVEISVGGDAKERNILAQDAKVSKFIDQWDDSNKLASPSSEKKIDACIVRVSPAMHFNNFNQEHIKYPENLIDLLNLELFQKEDALIVSGSQTAENYEEVLRQLKYYNSRADDIIGVTFSLTCSQVDTAFVSSPLRVELTVEHENPAAMPADLNKAQKPVDGGYMKENSVMDGQPHVPAVAHVKDNSLAQSLRGYDHSSVAAGSGLGMVIIVVVCVGFLLFMIGLGVMRIRTTHQRTREAGDGEKAEMEWDDSALTITVNPMDQQSAFEEGELGGACAVGADSDSDSDVELSHYGDEHDDCDDSSEEEPDIRELKSRGLEWDESDMSKFAHCNKV